MAAELRSATIGIGRARRLPLVAAEDAVVLDSTHLSEDEVLERIEEAGGAAAGRLDAELAKRRIAAQQKQVLRSTG